MFSLIFAAISLITFSDAHPSGSHYNRKTSEYHYYRRSAAKLTVGEKAYRINSTGRLTIKSTDTTEFAKDILAILPAIRIARFAEEQGDNCIFPLFYMTYILYNF